MRLSVYGNTIAAMTTAAVLADTGNQVWLMPSPGQIVEELIRRAELEPGLAVLLDNPSLHWADGEAGREAAWRNPVHFMVMAPEQENWAFQLAERIGMAERAPCVLVNRSTFSIGRSEALQAAVQRSGRPCELVVEPDFMTEGRAIMDFSRPDRILLGTESDRAEKVMRELYRPFNRNRDVVQRLSPRAAELAKFATNAMLATRVSFINEMAQLAEAFDVDIEQVRRALGSDRRIGFDFLYPGVGFGGPNFARDVQRLAAIMEARKVDSAMLNAVLAVNAQQKEALFRKVWQRFERRLSGRRFALWGVSYKPGTSSVENAPALALARALLAQGATLRVHDHRQAMAAFAAALSDAENRIVCCDDMYEAAQDCDGVMLLTEWKHYWHPDWSRLKACMRTPVMLDGRNIYDPATVRRQGFEYYGIGR